MASEERPPPPGNGATPLSPLAPGEWLPERAEKAVGTIGRHGSSIKQTSSGSSATSNTTPTTMWKVKFGDVVVLDCVSEVVVDQDSGKVLDMHLGVYDPSPQKHTSPLSAYEKQRVMEGRSQGKTYSRMGRMDEKKKLTLAKLGGYCKDGFGHDEHGGGEDADEEPPERPRSRSLFVQAPPSHDSDDDGEEEQNLEHMMDFPEHNSEAAASVTPSQEADTTPPPGTSSNASKRTSTKGKKKDCVVS